MAKMINNDLQNTTQKIKDRTTRTPLKTWDELRYSGRVSSSCWMRKGPGSTYHKRKRWLWHMLECGRFVCHKLIGYDERVAKFDWYRLHQQRALTANKRMYTVHTPGVVSSFPWCTTVEIRGTHVRPVLNRTFDRPPEDVESHLKDHWRNYFLFLYYENHSV